MEQKFITLPDREKMLTKLMSVNSHNELKTKFYPILLEDAGQEKHPSGLILMLQLAIHQYSNVKSMIRAISWQIPDFVNALVDDPNLRQETQDFYQKTLD